MITSCPLRLRPLILLVGDSLTQQGYGVNGGTGWASMLANAFSTRADVLNRGFSGYNSRLICQEVLKTLPEQADYFFCTVFLGANDAALPGERQHVPIEEYTDNLEKIVTHLR
jgi:lysophospholipase L1-like esterase